MELKVERFQSRSVTDGKRVEQVGEPDANGLLEAAELPNIRTAGRP
jgi:hypothetical protein